jgi:rubrerythrin
MDEKTIADVIETAIQREESAYWFYNDLAEKVSDADAKDAVLWIAGEEKKHREFLKKYRDGKYGVDTLRMSTVVEYKLAEYLEEPEAGDDMSSSEVFLIAAHREARSFEFYSELSRMHTGGELSEMLLKMANEELKHKEKMEYLYSNTTFAQTSGG